MAVPRLLLSSSAWLDSSDHSTRVWAPLPAYAKALLRALDSPLSLARRAVPLSSTNPAHKDSSASPSRAPIVPSVQALSQALAEAYGHWSLISSLGESILLATDRMRSLGLLYAFDGQRWIITDDVNSLLAHLPGLRRDERQAKIFTSFGYTLGRRTLLEGVSSVEAGSLVLLNPDGSTSTSSFADYRRPSVLIDEEAEFHALFEKALDQSFTRLLDAAGSRTLAVPLSGGFDSRLLLAWLTRLGASNIRTFTYGKPAAPEVGISHGVAQAFALPWVSVDYTPEKISSFWSGPEAEAFRRANWCGVSLPHVQDSYALHELCRSGWIDEDAILLPGHTIVGNGHDEDFVLSAPPAGELARLIASRHAGAQGRDRSINEEPLISREILRAAQQVRFDGSPASALSWVEWFNLRERQAKYINHSMRAYEFYERSWAAPMLDLDMWQTWLKGGLNFTKDRAWYARFVAAAVQGYAKAPTPPLHVSSNDHSLPPRLKGALLATMRATRTERLLSRSRSIRTMLDHPMAFEAFSAPLSKSQQFRNHLCGASSTGLWSTLFLDNRWGNDAQILPPPPGAPGLTR